MTINYQKNEIAEELSKKTGYLLYILKSNK